MEKGTLTLDLILDGLPRTSSIVIIGELGAGKSILSRQLLFEQLKKGETGIYVSSDEPPREVREHMKSFGWNIEPYEGKNLAIIDSYTWGIGATWILEQIKGKEEKYVVPSPAYPYQIIKVIKEAEKEVGKGTVILDSLTGITRIAYSEPELCLRFGKDILGEKIGEPIIVTVDEKIIEPMRIKALEAVSDVVIRLGPYPEGSIFNCKSKTRKFESKYSIKSNGVYLE